MAGWYSLDFYSSLPFLAWLVGVRGGKGQSVCPRERRGHGETAAPTTLALPGSSGAGLQVRCQGYCPHSQPALGDFPETALPQPASSAGRLHELGSLPVPVPSPASSPISAPAAAMVLHQAHVEVLGCIWDLSVTSRQGHGLPVFPRTARRGGQSVQPSLPSKRAQQSREPALHSPPPQSHPHHHHHCSALHSPLSPDSSKRSPKSENFRANHLLRTLSTR